MEILFTAVFILDLKVDKIACLKQLVCMSTDFSFGWLKVMLRRDILWLLPVSSSIVC